MRASRLHVCLLTLATSSYCCAESPGDFFPLPEEAVTTDQYEVQCKKTCLNSGYCSFGFDGNSLGTDQVEYCECSSSFYGEYCEHEAERCGDDHCYHGSKCFEILLADGSLEHICDCTQAYTEESSFAGEFCQYPSTRFCSGHDDPNGRQFCTNGGECPLKPHQPCSCPPRFSGPRCAFEVGVDGKEYAACNLDCKNGGTCQKGVKELEGYGKFANDVANMMDDRPEDFEHCTCPGGFYGIRCEYQVQKCGNGEHVCFHGATCLTNGDALGCTCEASEHLTAGLFCEFFATEDCGLTSANSEDPHRGFCTNGGTCLVDEDDAVHCACPFGFEGPHCEYRTKNGDAPNTTPPLSKSGPSTALILAIVVALSGTIGTSLWIFASLRQFIHSRTTRPPRANLIVGDPATGMSGQNSHGVSGFLSVEIL